MSNLPYPIEQIIHKASVWYVLSPDLFAAEITKDGDYLGAGTQYNVTAEELASLHPLLPLSLRGLADYSEKTKSTRIVSGLSLHYSLLLLKNEHVAFNDSRYTPRQIVDIEGIHGVYDTPTLICIKGKHINTKLAHVDNTAIQVITDVEYKHSAYVQRAELEKHYPGWEDRLRIAEELSIDMKLRGLYVFGKLETPSQLVSIEGLSFE